MTLAQAFVLTPLVDRQVLRMERTRIRRRRDHSMRAYKALKSKLASSLKEC